jgi:hypothetical chaperone protein
MGGLACGIDFGTSNSLAAVAGPEGVRVFRVDPENGDPHLLPSLLYFSRYGWNRVGRAAMTAYQADPDGRFIRSLKAALPEHSPEEAFRIFREPYTLPDLLQLVFARLKQRIEGETGETVTRATVGRPVHFSPDPELDRTAEAMLRMAARAAGFEELRFLTEPEAATRAYFHDEPEQDGTVLVFDFGGGTLDLCLARMEGGRYRILRTSGASIGGSMLDRLLFEGKLLKHLGQGQKWGRGLDLPNALFNRLVNPDANWKISEHEYTVEVRQILHATTASGQHARGLQQLYAVVSRRLGPDLFAAIEGAKQRLSGVEETEIRFEAEGVTIREPLTRADLRTLFAEPLERIRTLIGQTLDGAGHIPAQVDRVVLAGGSSALVCIQELLRDVFGPERVPLRQDLFTSIVSGLALDAAGTRTPAAPAPTTACGAS